MFRIALILIVVALAAAVLGFGGLAGVAAAGAELFFVVGLILVVLGLIFGRRWLA